MKKVVVFLADGFEEIEAIGTIDILRRCNIDVTICSIGSSHYVTAAHEVKVAPDTTIDKININDFDGFICPGGGVGAENLRNSKDVTSIIKSAFDNGKLVAAICAAPTVFEAAGIMKGKKATIYPSMKDYLKDASYSNDDVVIDGNIITGAGPFITFKFALAVAEYLVGKDDATQVGKDMLYIK